MELKTSLVSAVNEIQKEIISIEKTCFKDKEWYYYGITNSEKCSLMLKDGIKSQALSKNIETLDYKFYIPLYKDRMTGNVADWYRVLQKLMPMFVIDSKTLTIKCSDNSKLEPFINTIFPLRYSSMYDEYNAFLKIKPERIIGLQCALYNWSSGNPDIFQMGLKEIREILIFMKELGIDIPIYDNSRSSLNETHEIDKEGILDLSRKLK